MNIFKITTIIHLISRHGTFCNTILALMLLPMISRGQNYQCQWAHVAGNAAVVITSGQDVNSSGNVYVAGIYLNHNLSFDNSATVLNPNPDTTVHKLFLAKYDQEGNLLWSKSFESAGDAENPIVTIDDRDNIYLAGSFSNNIKFGALTLAQNQGYSGPAKFLAKFDSSGNVQWAKQSIYSTSYKVNDDGHIALYGAFLGPSVTLGNNLTLTNSDNSGQTTDFLIAELDSNGNLLWAKSGGVSGKSEEIDDVALTGDDQIYVSGLFESTFTLGGITLNSAGNTSWSAKDWFLARYDTHGNVSWAIRGGISLIAPIQLKDGALQIKTDQSNDLYFLGGFHQSTMQFDTLVLNGVGTLADFSNTYWFAGKYDGKDNLKWVKSGNSPVQRIHFIPDNDGGLYLTGTFRDTAVFGNITLNGTGVGNQTLDGFAVKLDNYGQVSWARHFGPLLKNSSIFDMVVDQHNTLDILGAYGDPKGLIPNLTLNFDSLFLTSVDGSRDYFLARYKDNGDILSASNIGSPAVDGLIPGRLNLVGQSGLYVSGGYSGTPLTLDTMTINFPVPSLNNYFVAKYGDNGTTTGINFVKPLRALYVFPNPTTGVLYLRSPEGLDNIQVFNVTGREAYHRALPIPRKEYILNLSRFPDGIYWLKVSGRDSDATRKIILRK
ncbi:MAG TPA: T9SS type A sorting domain-containing protein [Edaphocola sp.]|nr:T9SS type A sorting domain-containing protein [Edaphocola sp.]